MGLAINEISIEFCLGEGNALNPEAKGNSFVGDVKRSPLHLEGRSVELSPSEGGRVDDTDRSDWLACVSRRTGVPRLLLSLLLIISSVTIVWLCLTTSVSTKHRHLPVEVTFVYFEYVPSLYENKFHSKYISASSQVLKWDLLMLKYLSKK